MQLGWHGFARNMDDALASDDPKAQLAETACYERPLGAPQLATPAPPRADMVGSGRRRSGLWKRGRAAQSPVGGHGTGTSLDPSCFGRLQQQADTLLRNLYTETDEEGATTTPPEAAAAALRLAGYVQAQLTHLHAIPTEEMLRARVSWAPGTFS
jgi:hypothetical protein